MLIGDNGLKPVRSFAWIGFALPEATHQQIPRPFIARHGGITIHPSSIIPVLKLETYILGPRGGGWCVIFHTISIVQIQRNRNKNLQRIKINLLRNA